MNLITLQTDEPKWGPTGKDVYDRTYSRTKADGTKENWRETVERVVNGNLSLVDERFIEEDERRKLVDAIYNFRIIPAGRHLWMSGVEGRQFLFNCYVSGWGDSLSEHFAFTFNQLMEGGGVGSNYSSKYLDKYHIFNLISLHIVCSPEHEDYEEIKPYLSQVYSHDYMGAIEVDDSREGWTDALSHLIWMASHYVLPEHQVPGWVDGDCGEYNPVVVFDVSNLRPSGRRIKTFGGTSAGPVPFARMLTEVNGYLGEGWLNGFSGYTAMGIDHAIATCVVSGNVRRSARMSIMHWDDPRIDWFLSCKEDGNRFWSTNISVEIDDEFINLINTSIYEDSRTYVDERTGKARRVYKTIVEGMLKNGEPGIWNSSLSNIDEPNLVVSTNPCGEIALEEWENCNLGHVNLDAFVRPNGSVDFTGLVEAHRLMTRFLIRATYGDISNADTRAIVDRNRRIGVGHLGFAGYLAKRGIKFSESHWESNIDRTGNFVLIPAELEDFRDAVDYAAREYAHDLRIPVPVKTTTVAPTGTVAKLAGRTEGIHPPYAKYFIRRIRYSMVDPDQAKRVEEFRAEGYNIVEDPDTANTWIVEIPTKESLVQELEDLGIDPNVLESVDQIKLEDLIRVQRMYQVHYANNAVSYTMNVPKDYYSVPEVMEIMKPHLPYLKGTTIMVDESRRLAPYERLSFYEYYRMTDDVDGVVDDSYDEDCASGACPVR
jgi:ribonucleoside-triphosphate reductase